jgi:UDP-N-acetylglucosamine diphosphorylase/glucosamine-1-phosphate N-acetyltransferase
MTALYLLDPDRPGAAWAPFGTTRPLAELRAGAWTLAERWAQALDATVTGYLAPHARGPRPTGAVPLVDTGDVQGPCWVADSTCCPPTPMRAVGGAKRLLHEGRAVAWRLDPGESWRGPHDDGDGLVIEGLRLSGSWQLLTALEQLLFTDTLAALDGGSDPLPVGCTVLGNEAAIALRGAEVEPGVVFDVRKGAVILERGVQVQSGTRLEGPCWFREDTLLLGGRFRHVSAGPQCRLHGEISTTVFQGYANKSHDGFVGHSVIGEWVNLGAGTITSNLKNTYGPVRLDVGAERVDTGRTNVGALIGDHVKTAIGTLLGTGSVVGTGANLFGDPRSPKYVAPFAWGDDGTRLSLPAFLAVARRVLPRRGVTVDDATDRALTALYQRLTPVG